MAFTYEAHYERLMKMSSNQFFDHFSCMQSNIKHNTISQEHAQAMRDAFPHQHERAEAQFKIEREQERQRLQEQMRSASARMQAVADAGKSDDDDDEEMVERYVAGGGKCNIPVLMTRQAAGAM
jgi:predicted DNA-binding WGR domain protein